MNVDDPFDDGPDWMRGLRKKTTDNQPRCVICAGLLLPLIEGEIRTDENAHEECFRLDVLRQQVRGGAVTDWYHGCWPGYQSQRAGLFGEPSFAKCSAEVRAILSMFNKQHGTAFRLY